MESKYFILTKNTKFDIFGKTLFQIQATKDLPKQNVKKGDLGGYIQNDSQVFGDAWVSDNAQVSGDARVFGDARVYGNSRVSGEASIFGNARVYGNSWVYGNAQVSGNAEVCGTAHVSSNAWISDNAQVNSFASIIVIDIGGNDCITITKKFIFIGRQVFETKDLNKIPKGIGLDDEEDIFYKNMISAALKLVKNRGKI